jgi:hypothetical protein
VKQPKSAKTPAKIDRFERLASNMRMDAMNRQACRTDAPRRPVYVAVAAVLLLGACANTPTANARLAVARAALNDARGADAAEFAPLQLKSAAEKIDAAERAVATKDHELARRLAEQAEVDARLAAAMARSAKTQRAADALQEDIRVLRQEIERKAQ